MIKIIHRRDIIKESFENWRKQYPDRLFTFWNGRTVGEVKQELDELDPETCSAEDVKKVLSTSWAENECDLCEKDCQMTIHIGDEPDYEARWQRLCRECLIKAIVMMTETQPKP